ncbi:hypothetical protein GCM10010347_13670 [Streptomyces cirratus]|uniref:Uncharacterized protein n=1 Tax=Streptomyces cirratus TaxID=68187 RepID=A0ABQ3EPY1_9ACTN|nr:hypothetical protein GCM10010347_13670 [Streptomyces cirratus]
MIALTAGDCGADAEGEPDAEDDPDGDGEAALPSSVADCEEEGTAADADAAEDGEPAAPDFCGPQAVAASATAVAIPSVRTIALWRFMVSPVCSPLCK